MKVRWTNEAEAHLDAIFAYIAQDSGNMQNEWWIA